MQTTIFTPTTFIIGDSVSFQNNQNITIKGTFISYAPIITFCKILGEDGLEYERKVTQVKFISRPQPETKPKIEVKVSALLAEKIPKKEIKKAETAFSEPQKYSINQRFEFLESLVRMVGKGFRNSLIITGEGGLGKSYTIKQEFDALGLKPYDPETGIGDYKKIKGTSTARGLFNTIKKYNGLILIFDDCKKVLLDSIMVEILKGALESEKNRTVCWVTADGDNEIEYTGRMIFLANLQHSQLDKAVKTRASCVDVSMTADEIIQRMRWIAGKEGYRPLISEELKNEALDIIEANKHCTKLSMRTMLEAFDFIESGEANWRDLLIYSMQ